MVARDFAWTGIAIFAVWMVMRLESKMMMHKAKFG